MLYVIICPECLSRKLKTIGLYLFECECCQHEFSNAEADYEEYSKNKKGEA